MNIRLKRFLQKLKLIDHLVFEISITRNDFVEQLCTIVDQKRLGFFSEILDFYSLSDNELKGIIDYGSFKVKRRRNVVNTNNGAIAYGKVIEENGNLKIEVEIVGYDARVIFFFVFLIIYELAVIISIITTGDYNVLVFLFFAIPTFLMSAILIFLMRQSVKKLKDELEKSLLRIKANSSKDF